VHAHTPARITHINTAIAVVVWLVTRQSGRVASTCMTRQIVPIDIIVAV
jgi:hypothetical protein